mgnify:FL=1
MITAVPITDPRVLALFDARYREMGRCDVAVLDLEGETPVAGIAGRQGPLPVMIHLACRRWGTYRVQGLIGAFVAEMGRRGAPVTITALDSMLRQSALLRRICRRVGGTRYAIQPPLEWWAFYVEGVT